MENRQIEYGQFYTVRNPFSHILVREWFEQIPNMETKSFAEPFAGANNIIALVEESFPQVALSQWTSYDIDPEAVKENQVPAVPLVQRDTIKNPVRADVVITNPPYLAKNSAKRRGYTVDFEQYQDLYEVAVSRLLAYSDYVAAIIPESFMTRKLFRERLFGFISVTDNLFDDTDFPVGIALWTPEKQDDFTVYVGNTRAGKYQDILQRSPFYSTQEISPDIKTTFNDPQGILGFHAIDNTSSASIRFVRGDTIPAESIKISSRAITRITVTDSHGIPLITEENLDNVIASLNQKIHVFRESVSDILLTSFKGLRKDGLYRRRFDFRTTKQILKSIDYTNNDLT